MWSGSACVNEVTGHAVSHTLQKDEDALLSERYERGELLLYKAEVLREGRSFVKALKVLNDSQVPFKTAVQGCWVLQWTDRKRCRRPPCSQGGASCWRRRQRAAPQSPPAGTRVLARSIARRLWEDSRFRGPQMHHQLGLKGTGR